MLLSWISPSRYNNQGFIIFFDKKKIVQNRKLLAASKKLNTFYHTKIFKTKELFTHLKLSIFKRRQNKPFYTRGDTLITVCSAVEREN